MAFFAYVRQYDAQHGIGEPRIIDVVLRESVGHKSRLIRSLLEIEKEYGESRGPVWSRLLHRVNLSRP